MEKNMSDYQHILLATDLTATGELTARKARELADKYNAKLSMVHVVESLPGYASGYIGVVDLEEEMKEEAGSKLSDMGKIFQVSETDQYLEMGSPKIMILDLAKELAVNLIVLGSHGRHGLERLLGSTSSSVLHGSLCDVLIVHHQKT